MNRVLQRKPIILICCLVFFLTAFGSKIYSQTNSGIPYVFAFQGIISEKDGSAIPDGSYDISFALYDVKEGGTPLWREDHSALEIKNGVISVLIGKKNINNPISVIFDRKYFLDITINTDLIIRQRIELGTAAYSLGSEFAETVDNNSITTEKFADEAVTDEKIVNVSSTAIDDISPDPYSIYWTILGNFIWGPERNYIGTIEAKDFVIKTFSIERMRFGPTGRVTMGTPADTVEFTVIGKTKTQNTFIKGDLGVGVRPGGSRVHIKSHDIPPFRVDINDQTRFLVKQNGRVEITTDVGGGSDNDRDAYPLFINSEDQGIGIKLKGSTSNDNNFVSFWNNKGMQGRIEGENFVDWLADPCVIMRDAYMIATVAADVTAFAMAPVEPASCVAFTAETVFNAIMVANELANLGVTYESSSGDYAEWLAKADVNESFEPGEIVGILNGRISKYTLNADQLSCISLAPVVLGKMPPKDQEYGFEKVAFIGQVPVKVIGIVRPGDYIIPSGLNNGTGIAVAPELMTIDEYLNVVGRAWSGSDNEGLKFINTAIGFDNHEIVKILQLQEQKEKILFNAVRQAESKIKEANQKIFEMNSEIKKVATQLKDKNENITKTSSGL